jgi:hypothetical protein
LAIACLVASFSWCILRNQKAQVYLGLFYIYEIYFL